VAPYGGRETGGLFVSESRNNDQASTLEALRRAIVHQVNHVEALLRHLCNETKDHDATPTYLIDAARLLEQVRVRLTYFHQRPDDEIPF
jgi:hypothetical protein